jgi:hypothetical protein
VESYFIYHRLRLGHFQIEFEREENEVDPAIYLSYVYNGFLASETGPMERANFQIDERSAARICAAGFDNVRDFMECASNRWTATTVGRVGSVVEHLPRDRSLSWRLKNKWEQKRGRNPRDFTEIPLSQKQVSPHRSRMLVDWRKQMSNYYRHE